MSNVPVPLPAEGIVSVERAPAVAGAFYPGDPDALLGEVRAYLDRAGSAASTWPKALIAPHAGYRYSGAVAGRAYARLAPGRGRIERVVLLGPAHRVPVDGMASSGALRFRTPLGAVRVDREAVDRAEALCAVRRNDAAHAQEHSLEVQLPFLQAILGDFSLVPLCVGRANDAAVAEVLERLWGGPETVLVVSSDLSHYRDYQTALRLDAATSAAIEALDPRGLGVDSACGRAPIRGLLVAARRRGLRARTLGRCNSGDTGGSRAEVVGYGAYVFE